jgi:hypothetical protein
MEGRPAAATDAAVGVRVPVMLGYPVVAGAILALGVPGGPEVPGVPLMTRSAVPARLSGGSLRGLPGPPRRSPDGRSFR